MTDNIVKKIQKLLSLATSPNEHEAQVAASKAQELLVRHNLTMQHVEKKPDEYQKATFYEGGKRHPSLGAIIPILEKFFFVNVVQIRNGKVTSFEMIGTETNVKIAMYVADFLIEKFKILWKNYQSDNGCGINQRTAFWWGLKAGLEHQLEAKRSKVETEMGLVVVPDPGLKTALTVNYGRLKGETVGGKIRSNEALEAGTQMGRNLQIQRGLEQQSSSGLLYLGGKK